MILVRNIFLFLPKSLHFDIADFQGEEFFFVVFVCFIWGKEIVHQCISLLMSADEN